MCRRLALVVAAFAVVLLVRETRADACGVKLNIKAPRIKKQADRSTNPSQILLLGDPPRSLSKELSARGHKVEVAAGAEEARRVKYHAIVADPDRADEARTRWPGAVVVVRRGNAKADANLVEDQLGASPNRTLVARTPDRTSRDDRALIRTGPDTERTAPVASGSGGATEERALEASGTSEPPTTTAAATPPVPGPITDASRPARTKRVAAVTADTSADVNADDEADRPARFTKRIFFGNGSSALSARVKAKLMKNAKWLQTHGDSALVVEGHASATGNADANQALSEARARSVKEFLVEQGVADSRITSEALGSSKPEFRPGSNGKNRRVVIKVQ